MKRLILSIITFVSVFAAGYAQELNVKLTINSQKVQTTSRDKFTTLESSLKTLLNEQKWTDATFARNERIDCSIAITINEAIGDDSFKGEIQIVSRRPVYNSSYITTLINLRDTQFEFDFTSGQSLDFNAMNINDNLTATLAFYAYIIIGLDFDSFSLNGGRPYFEKAMSIANAAQSLNTKGWEPFSGKGNRYDLAVALTEESSKDFHSMWYNYHRMGLDEMSANPTRGRIRIIESIGNLKNLYNSRPSSMLFTMYAEAKISELVRVCSEANTEEKQELKKILLQFFPTKTTDINLLK